MPRALCCINHSRQCFNILYDTNFDGKLNLVNWRIITKPPNINFANIGIDYHTSQSASSLHKKRARSKNLPRNVSNYVCIFPNGYSIWVKCITVFRLTWKVLSCSRHPNVLIHVKATYTAFHHVRLQYFRTKWILWCKRWHIYREHDMHMNCIAGKMERQFTKETNFRQLKILPIANF